MTPTLPRKLSLFAIPVLCGCALTARMFEVLLHELDDGAVPFVHLVLTLVGRQLNKRLICPRFEEMCLRCRSAPEEVVWLERALDGSEMREVCF